MCRSFMEVREREELSMPWVRMEEFCHWVRESARGLGEETRFVERRRVLHLSMIPKIGKSK